jgi:hypothetical protein
VLSSPIVPFSGNDETTARAYAARMATQPQHDWYLKEWLAATSTAVSVLERETGWTHRIASQLVNRRTRWNRDHLVLAARVLHIHPFELLLHPEDAMQIRRLRVAVNEEARLRVAEGRETYAPQPEPADRLAPRKLTRS